MEIQKSTMITTVRYSKDKKERFLLTKEWDKGLPKKCYHTNRQNNEPLNNKD